MASSRQSRKSESKLKNGSDSRRSSLSSASSADSTKEEIIDLGIANDAQEAEKNMKAWLLKQLKNPQGNWIPRWGTKFTDGAKDNKGLANLGRVIGQEFVPDTKSNSKDEKIERSNFRVDWDTIKGKHYNAVLRAKINDRYIAYPFGKLSDDLEIHSITKKAIGEQMVIDRMLALTATALDDNKLMSVENAQKILKTFKNPSKYVKEYFKEAAHILRKLISQANQAVQKSNQLTMDRPDNSDNADLLDKVSDLLQEVWSLELSEQLQLIYSDSDIEFTNPQAYDVLINECIFAGS